MAMVTIIEYFGEQSEYRCGYCKSVDTNYSHGMWAHMMLPEDYQNLIDRGWRRSGQYVYKPTNNMACCPAYTINCHALEFHLTNSQKKVLKRFNRYLSEPNFASAPSDKVSDEDGSEAEHGSENITALAPKKDFKPAKIQMNQMDWSQEAKVEAEKATSSGGGPSRDSLCSSSGRVAAEKGKIVNLHSQVGLEGKPVLKAKELRLQRKINKLIQKGIDPSTVPLKKTPNTQPKSLEDLIAEGEGLSKKFYIRTVKVDSPEFNETFDAEYSLYRHYQINVHKDKESECTPKQFKRFLCDNPFKNLDDYYGTYHQQYYIDDTLMAVGVVDILPSCLSSVYFFYSTDYMHLSPGTFGALREIAFLREIQKDHPSIKYYYMGFYIHSCVKMRYKGAFSPSYLLCPEMYTWHPLDERTRETLTASKYTRLNESEAAKPASSVPVGEVRILYRGLRTNYAKYSRFNRAKDKTEVQEYADLVGPESSKTMLLYRPED